jgi:RNA polymerase sigma factor (sigma-70 family)
MSDSTVQTIRPTDGELITQFIRQGDPVAFRLLVERHARLVWAVCRRVLRQQQDIEDAYQATFLVLARQAKSIRSQHSLAGWLFTVAHRTAVERHQRQEQELDHEPAAQRQTLAEIHERERFEALAAELNRLPERLRAPLILFYLEGESRQATAEQLDVTEAAIKSRLARGRSLLRSRLMRRGVSLSIAVGSMVAGSSVSQAAVATVLLEQTVSSAVELATTGKVLSCSKSCVSLSQGIQPMATMTISKTVAAAGLLLTAGLLTAIGLGPNPLAANSAN